MGNAWHLYDPATPSTLDRWIAAVYALVRRFGQGSASHAALSYQQARRDAIPGQYTTVLPPPVPEAAVQAAMRWAVTVTRTPYDPAVALAKADGAATKLALDAGRGTILGNVAADRKAQAWVRVARPNACSFCRLLAIRGPVYHTEQSAGFQAHNLCRCFPSPIFAGQKYQAPPDVLEWRRQYEESTAGKHGADARKAFRQAVEGRTPTS